MAAQRWLVVVLVVTLLLAAIAHASASVDGTLELSIDECARVPDQLYSAKKYVTVKGLDFDEYASQHPLEVLPWLWSRVIVSLENVPNTGEPMPHLVVGDSAESLVVAAKAALFAKGHSTSTAPFGTTHLVVTGHPRGDIQCQVQGVFALYPILFVVGLFLILNSRWLSRSVLVYYSTGVSLGTFLSVLALVIFILLKLKGNRLAQVGIVVGSSVGFTFGLARGMVTSMIEFSIAHWAWAASYAAICALLIFVYMYYKGPPTSPRTFHIIQGAIFMAGLGCLAFASSSTQGSVVFVLLGIVTIPLLLFLRLLLSSVGCHLSCSCCRCRRHHFVPQYMSVQQFEHEKVSQGALHGALKRRLHRILPVDKDTARQMVEELWDESPRIRRRFANQEPRHHADGSLVEPEEVSDIDEERDWADLLQSDGDDDGADSDE